MPRSSEWGERLKRLEERLDPAHRLVDTAVQFQVWGCTCGKSHLPPDKDPESVRQYLSELGKMEHKPAPFRVLPTVYGRKYDRLKRQYVGDPDRVHLISCHEGQLDVIGFGNPDVLRVLALGGPGSGKSFALERLALRKACERANSIGAIITPTQKGRERIWNEFLDLITPLGFVEELAYARGRIVLVNRSVVLILSAKSSGRQYGSPLQGYTLDWALVDESQNVDDAAHTEIAARGRLAGKEYFILETATNAQHGSFRLRLEEFKTNEQRAVVSFSAGQNPWVGPDWWERLRKDMSERQYREFVLAEDLPPEFMTYPEFRFGDTVCRRPASGDPIPDGAPDDFGRPPVWLDVTQRLVEQKFGRKGVRWIGSQDFGVLTSTTIFLKAYQRSDRPGDRYWWACDEITSHHVTADVHAKMILSGGYDPDELVLVADPHFNSKESDKSDYHLTASEGLTIFPAVHGKIPQKHRINMVRALLCDSDGVRRLFIDCDHERRPACRKLTQSFMTQQLDARGQAETDKKDMNDMTHYTAATGYGLFPWERVRGQSHVQFLRDP